MRRTLSALLVVLAAVLSLLGIEATAHAAGPALRIMPLGDSITYGVGSSTTSSYRADLWNSVTGAGYSLDFVGSVKSGVLPDPDNEGHSGFRIDQIAALAPCDVAGSRPNVVTLHLGTNDMGQDYQVDTAPARLGTLIDQILAADPGVTVLVATLVPSSDPTVESRIGTYNQQIPALVAQRQNAGEHVRLVDMSAVTTADLSDSLHPNDGGYQKMSDAFYAGLQQSLSAGWITDPAPQSAAGGCVHGIIKGTQSGRCLDVPNSSQTDGTAVGLWDCTEGANQEWTLSPNRQLMVYGTRCLDTSGGGTADGTPVLIWDCTGATNQQWTVEPDGTIVGAGSGKCLDATGQNTGNGTALEIWTCNGGPNQQWQTSKLGALKGQESGRCVDVPGGNTANGTAPALWDCNGGTNQQWTATASNRLTVFDNKCLDISGGGTADGTPVLIWDCTGGTNQQWTVNPDGTVVGVASGKCLDAVAHGTGNATALDIWTCTGSGNQKWSRQ